MTARPSLRVIAVQVWEALRAVLVWLLPFTPPRYAGIAIAAFGLLCAVVAFFLYPSADPQNLIVRPARLAALTVDGRDLDIQRPAGGAARIVRSVGRAPSGVAEQAPLMDWEVRPIRRGESTNWCFQGDPEANDVARAVLTQLAGRFPPRGGAGFVWREDCNRATFFVKDTAQEHCGIGNGAVACAGPERFCGTSEWGDSWCGGTVSYNGNYRQYTLSGGRRGDAPGLDRQGLVVAFAHEVQHLVLNLGHNSCGRVLDSQTNRAVPSVMTPLYLPSGPSCSDPPAQGLTEEDWPLALQYYRITTGTTPPSPTPTATPSARYEAQIWAPDAANPNCPGERWQGWCVPSVPIPMPQSPACAVIIRRNPDGTGEWVSECVGVRP